MTAESRGIQICAKQQAKRFSSCGAPSRKTGGLYNKVNGKGAFAILPFGFVKSLIFQLYARESSLMNGKAGAVSTIMVVCLALVAIMKIGVAATAIGIDEKTTKNGKCEIVCKKGLTGLYDSNGSLHLYI